MIKLAIYDMDRTITRAGTFTPFLLYWAIRYAPWRLIFVPVAALFGIAYLLRLIPRGRLKELNQWLLLGKPRRSKLAVAAEGFADLITTERVYKQALLQIAEDKAEGRRVIMATASYLFYVEPIARKLEIPEIIATPSRWAEDILLPKIDGQNCYGDDKKLMIEAFMRDAGLKREECHIRFYSDHVSDQPTFEWADEPIAANPGPRLRSLAQARGWTILDWN